MANQERSARISARSGEAVRHGMLAALCAVALVACADDPPEAQTDAITDSGFNNDLQDDGAVDLPDAWPSDLGAPPTDAPDSDSGDGPSDADGAASPDADIEPDTDGGLVDVTDADAPDSTPDADASDTTPPSTNACGGTNALKWSGLDALPGDPCRDGLGTIVCNGPDALRCTWTPTANACGTTGLLPAGLGEACGCGGTVVCAPDGGVECLSGVPANPCGGCAVLDGRPGYTCEIDGQGGQYACLGLDELACSPGAGNACGGDDVLVDGESAIVIGAACATDCGPGQWICDGTTAATCVPDRPCNACGGSGTLSGMPGDACGACDDGVWVCDGTDATTCEGAGTPNVCGGCGIIDNPPAEPCEGDGTWACGWQETYCQNGELNPCGGAEPLIGPTDTEPVLGDTCGPCAGGHWLCASPDDALCGYDTTPQNACGGCAPLAGESGLPCGACGSGTTECDGTDALDCADALAEVDAVNACGSCGELPADLGTECGTCLTWQCRDSGATCTPFTGSDACDGVLSCAELSCGDDLRACVDTDGVVDAECGACISGAIEDGGACRPLIECPELNCDAAFRACVAETSTTDATCDECLLGYEDLADVCLPVDCEAPPEVENATFTADGTGVDDVATYACEPGYDLVGAGEAVCGIDGNWTLDAECAPVVCPELLAPANGAVDAGGRSYSDTRIFTCDDGYLPIGASEVRCETDAQWSSATPRCISAGAAPDVCSTDGECPAEWWCPTDTLPALRRCSPRPSWGDDDMPFVFIPAGTFAQGGSQRDQNQTDYPHEEPPPRFSSTISFDYFMSQHHLTNGHWEDIMTEHNLRFGTAYQNRVPTSSGNTYDRSRSLTISRWDTFVLMNAMSRMEDLEPCYELADCNAETRVGISGCYGSSGCSSALFSCATVAVDLTCEGFRIATEAEWERAARGGTSTAYFWGNEPSLDIAVRYGIIPTGIFGGRPSLAAEENRVAAPGFLPNPFGLYQMLYFTEHVDGGIAPYPSDPQIDYAYQPASSAQVRGQLVTFSDVVQLQASRRGGELGSLLGKAVVHPMRRTSSEPPAVQCAPPNWPENGTVQTIGLQPGARATAVCDIGFSAMNDAVRVCTHEGIWSGTDAICGLTDCGSPPEVRSATATYESTLRGSTVQYNCQEGTQPVELNRLLCYEDGVWRGTTGCAAESTLCSSDDDCGDGEWCPTDTYPALQQCAPRLMTDLSIPMDFVRVPAGTNVQGFVADEPWWLFNTTGFVSTISRDFWLGRTEVTQAQWHELTGENPSVSQDLENPDAFGDRPVEGVSWYSALAFANQLSAIEGYDACYDLLPFGCEGEAADWGTGTTTCQIAAFIGPACTGYRLPTEAEWERSVRGGSSTQFPTGDDPPSAAQTNLVGWWSGNSGGLPNPVGQLQPNPYGAFDMLGNVSELVWDGRLLWDTYGIRRYGAITNLVFNVEPNTSPILRGGSFLDSAYELSHTSRAGPNAARSGLRLIRTILE
jgi:formylglycine-generating enzyme required for sulfatase activity